MPSAFDTGCCTLAPAKTNNMARRSNVASPTTTMTSRTNLFVRYLPKEVDDAELVELFSPFGPIATSMVMRDIHTGESLGTAFVRYEQPRDAEEAKAKMDHLHLYNKKLAIQWARREHDFKTANNEKKKLKIYKLFLRNVPLDVTSDALAALLSVYGTVTAVSIHSDTQRSDEAQSGSQTEEFGLPTPRSAEANIPTPRSAEAGNGICIGPDNDELEPHAQTKVFAQSELPPVPRSPPTLPSPVRRIAFVTFAEDGSAEQALKGVHHSCPFASCDGIPFMGKLINDTLLSKRQQQQTPFMGPAVPYAVGQPPLQLLPQSYGTPTSVTGPYAPMQVPCAHMTPTRLENAVMSPAVYKSPCAVAGAQSFSSHTTSPVMAACSATSWHEPSGTSNGTGYPSPTVLAATPRSRNNSSYLTFPSGLTPPSGPNSNAAPPADRMLPRALSTRSLHINATPNSPVSTPTTSASTPSRTRRYSHNPYNTPVLLEQSQPSY